MVCVSFAGISAERFFAWALPPEQKRSSMGTHDTCSSWKRFCTHAGKFFLQKIPAKNKQAIIWMKNITNCSLKLKDKASMIVVNYFRC